MKEHLVRLGPAPAKTVLLGLTGLVLAGHWLALGGPLPNWWGSSPTSSDIALSSSDPTGLQVASTGLPPPPAPLEMPTRVASSTVRWIVPKPPPPPAVPPAPPPRMPVKKKVVAPAEAPDPAALETLIADAPAFEVPEEPMQGLEALAPTEMDTPSEPATSPPDTVAPTTNAAAAIAKAAPATSGVPVGESPAAAPLPPVQLPANARLRYDVAAKVKGFSFTAGGQLNWSAEGNRYEARLEVSAFLLGSIVQTSTGSVSPTGLAPDRFSDKRRNEKSAEFDRSAQRIRFSSNGREDPLLAGTQDQVSISLQLGGLLNANPQYTEGQILSLPVSSTSSTETWRFDIGPETTVDLPAGPIVARLLTRQPRRSGDKKVQIWLAPALQNLPVRIRISESNGDFLDQSLEEMPVLAASLPPS